MKLLVVAIPIIGFPIVGIACNGATAPEVVEVTVDRDHPCPAWALAPEQSSLWEDHITSEEPVPLALALPLPDGMTVAVTQGNHGSSHVDDQAFAYDFDVPVGTPVHAAAPGVVVWVDESHSEFGDDASFRDLANFVVLDHGGGLFTAYVHLDVGGIDVEPGDVVEAGDRLGVTGLSGQLTGPHLHFHVENAWSVTLPSRFVGAGGCDLFPQAGDRVTGDPGARAHLVGRLEVSDVVPDTWAENDVVELEGMPARILDKDQVLQIGGATTMPGAAEVVLLLLPPAGGNALAVRRWDVHDGIFEGRLDLRDVAAGSYGMAFAAGDGGGVSVPRSVRTVLVR